MIAFDENTGFQNFVEVLFEWGGRLRLEAIWARHEAGQLKRRLSPSKSAIAARRFLESWKERRKIGKPLQDATASRKRARSALKSERRTRA